MDDLGSKFEETARAANVAQQAIADKLKQSADRSHIAKLIIWAFVILVAVVVVAALVGAYLFNWIDDRSV